VISKIEEYMKKENEETRLENGLNSKIEEENGRRVATNLFFQWRGEDDFARERRMLWDLGQDEGGEETWEPTWDRHRESHKKPKRKRGTKPKESSKEWLNRKCRGIRKSLIHRVLSWDA